MRVNPYEVDAASSRSSESAATNLHIRSRVQGFARRVKSLLPIVIKLRGQAARRRQQDRCGQDQTHDALLLHPEPPANCSASACGARSRRMCAIA
jgi:hypothetical protein